MRSTLTVREEIFVRRLSRPFAGVRLYSREEAESFNVRQRANERESSRRLSKGDERSTERDEHALCVRKITLRDDLRRLSPRRRRHAIFVTRRAFETQIPLSGDKEYPCTCCCAAMTSPRARLIART